MEEKRELIKAGLILEGGGMRGVYTAGVLDFFLDKGLEFEEVYGVSAGSVHACSYLSKQRGRAISVSIDYLKDPRYCGVRSLIKTGDESTPLLLAVVMAGSGLVLLLFCILQWKEGRRRKKEEA